MKAITLALALAASLLGGLAHAQSADKKVLTLEGARLAIDAASEQARRLKSPGGAITVVDDGGHIIAMERWDNTFPAAAQVSFGKARTAALFRKQTKAFEDAVNGGRFAMTALPDTLMTPLQGGVPIIVNGQTLGAVGVSGAASAAQDEELATAGAQARRAWPRCSSASRPARRAPSRLPTIRVSRTIAHRSRASTWRPARARPSCRRSGVTATHASCRSLSTIRVRTVSRASAAT
jgi:glc operon protein GlcG